MQYIENGEKLQPKELWSNFDKLLGIPHPSKGGAKITAFMKKFGKDLGLETIVDEAGNVIIKKPATPGMEDRKTIVLQSHLDMVPQKNSDKIHDFAKDPIQAYVDGKNVTAKGTTLGADNGMGVAAAMTILEAKDIKHGPIEALFTADEEVGMVGAFALKAGLLKGSILINTDSEEEGELYIGCAGGINSCIEYKYEATPVPTTNLAYKITISGLKGGHSGADIHLGRGNANKIINRIMWNVNKNCPLALCSIDAGGLRNAIPREATATITISKSNSEQFKVEFTKQANEIKSTLKIAEPELKINFNEVSLPETAMSEKYLNKFLNAIYAAPCGVVRMSDSMPGLTETSTNLAQIVSDGKIIKVLFMTRSSIDSEKLDVANTIQSVFELIGAKVEHSDSYPGWAPDRNSESLKLSIKTYKDLFNVEPKINAIHAGLECGLFKTAYPDMDIISFGPEINCAHSPDEYIEIESVGKFWELFVAVIENIPAK